MNVPESSHSSVAASTEAADLTARAAAPTEQPEGTAGTGSPPLLSRSDQLLVALLCGAALVLFGIRHYQLTRWDRPPATLVHSPDVSGQLTLDINTASWVEWMQLEGIGETLARRIVSDRESAGPFASIDDLTRVRGIGPKTVDRLRPWLRESSAAVGAGSASAAGNPLPPSR